MRPVENCHRPRVTPSKTYSKDISDTKLLAIHSIKIYLLKEISRRQYDTYSHTGYSLRIYYLFASPAYNYYSISLTSIGLFLNIYGYCCPAVVIHWSFTPIVQPIYIIKVFIQLYILHYKKYIDFRKKGIMIATRRISLIPTRK